MQAQTRVLMRALQRLRIPALIFVNKVDRGGASDASVLAGIAEKLTAAVVSMGAVEALGTRGARVMPGVPGRPRVARRSGRWCTPCSSA